MLPEFGRVRLAEITPTMVRRWVAGLAGRREPATVQKALQTLRKILDVARQDGLIAANPASGIRGPKVEQAEMRALAPDDLRTLADAIDPRYRAAVLVAGYGGLRAGELFGLTGKRADPLRGRLDIVRTVTEVHGQLLVGEPKTQAGRRVVPLPRSIADELADHMKRHAVGEEDPVFAAPAGGFVRLASWRSRFWKPAVKAAGLEPLRIHDLRHTAVSLWIAAGASPKEVAVRAGHRSVSTVLDRYGHLLPGSEEATNRALDAMVEGAAKPGS